MANHFGLLIDEWMADGGVLGGGVQPGKISAVFPMRFRDDTDLAVATSFFQELQDAGKAYPKAPRCSWSPIPPPELRGESVHHLTTNGGFVSFGAYLGCVTPSLFLVLSCWWCQLPSGSNLTYVQCRHLGAAREEETGGQDGVDPAKLPVLRQVPHQG